MNEFSVKVDGLDFLEKRLDEARSKIADQYIKIINDSVIEISSLAKSKVPIKTGLLKDSIGYSLYNTANGASVYASAHYAPYVEFGTGEKFGIPIYGNVNMSKLENYAHTFKRNKAVIGLPYRPFMFNSYSEVYNKMLNRIKGITI